MSKKPKIYFAHPINTYNTELEKFLLAVIGRGFENYEILNPNSPEHEAGYQQYGQEKGNGMLYFIEKVLPQASSCIALPFRDNKVPAGVAKEVRFYLGCKYPVWIILPDGSYGLLRNQILRNETVLSVAETRARIRDADGNPIPY